MAEDKTQNIPILEDVVEIGTPEEERIQIVADNSSVDDAYDDEFNKLFDSPDEQQSVSIDMDAEMAEDSDNELWDDSALQMVENSSGPAADSTSTTADDLDGISMTAAVDPVEIGSGAEENNDMWIQDWQEEMVESAIIDDMDSDLEITHATAVGTDNIVGAVADTSTIEMKDEAPVDDDPAGSIEQPTIIKAMQEDAPVATPSPVAVIPVETDTPDPHNRLALKDADEIPHLVNAIIAEIMPEIEWKLRTRIRDILEQHFDSED